MEDEEEKDWRNEFIEKLADKVEASGVCKECGGQLAVDEDFISPITWEPGKPPRGGRAFPQAMTICQNCGNTKYYNLAALGMTPWEESNE